LIRNDLLNQVGLFDERFAPAYYEDTDLSFKLREIGYEVWVCHSSRVIHHEGLSHGDNTDVLVKTNRDKFLLKWEAALLDHYENSNDPELILKAAMRQNTYADSEIMTDLKNLLWFPN
jgi:GT2 family glycosyltransferase